MILHLLDGILDERHILSCHFQLRQFGNRQPDADSFRIHQLTQFFGTLIDGNLRHITAGFHSHLLVQPLAATESIGLQTLIIHIYDIFGISFRKGKGHREVTLVSSQNAGGSEFSECFCLIAGGGHGFLGSVFPLQNHRQAVFSADGQLFVRICHHFDGKFRFQTVVGGNRLVGTDAPLGKDLIILKSNQLLTDTVAQGIGHNGLGHTVGIDQCDLHQTGIPVFAKEVTGLIDGTHRFGLDSCHRIIQLNDFKGILHGMSENLYLGSILTYGIAVLIDGAAPSGVEAELFVDLVIAVELGSGIVSVGNGIDRDGVPFQIPAALVTLDQGLGGNGSDGLHRIALDLCGEGVLIVTELQCHIAVARGGNIGIIQMHTGELRLQLFVSKGLFCAVAVSDGEFRLCQCGIGLHYAALIIDIPALIQRFGCLARNIHDLHRKNLHFHRDEELQKINGPFVDTHIPRGIILGIHINGQILHQTAHESVRILQHLLGSVCKCDGENDLPDIRLINIDVLTVPLGPAAGHMLVNFAGVDSGNTGDPGTCHLNGLGCRAAQQGGIDGIAAGFLHILRTLCQLDPNILFHIELHAQIIQIVTGIGLSGAVFHLHFHGEGHCMVIIAEVRDRFAIGSKVFGGFAVDTLTKGILGHYRKAFDRIFQNGDNDLLRELPVGQHQRVFTHRKLLLGEFLRCQVEAVIPPIFRVGAGFLGAVIVFHGNNGIRRIQMNKLVGNTRIQRLYRFHGKGLDTVIDNCHWKLHMPAQNLTIYGISLSRLPLVVIALGIGKGQHVASCGHFIVICCVNGAVFHGDFDLHPALESELNTGAFREVAIHVLGEFQLQRQHLHGFHRIFHNGHRDRHFIMPHFYPITVFSHSPSVGIRQVIYGYHISKQGPSIVPSVLYRSSVSIIHGKIRQLGNGIIHINLRAVRLASLVVVSAFIEADRFYFDALYGIRNNEHRNRNGVLSQCDIEYILTDGPAVGGFCIGNQCVPSKSLLGIVPAKGCRCPIRMIHRYIRFFRNGIVNADLLPRTVIFRIGIYALDKGNRCRFDSFDGYFSFCRFRRNRGREHAQQHHQRQQQTPHLLACLHDIRLTFPRR